MEMLMILFTGVIALSTLIYAIYTGALWKATLRNAEEARKSMNETKKFFQFNFLLHMRDTVDDAYKKDIDKVILTFYQRDFGEIIQTIRKQSIIDPQNVFSTLKNELSIGNIKTLMDNDDLEGAEEVVLRHYSGNPSSEVIGEYVKVLLAFRTKEKCDIALNLLREHKSLKLDPGLYGRVGYMYWTLKELDKAIEVAVMGLELAEQSGASESILLKYKNSLAYYYADKDYSTKRVDFEKISRDYVEELSDKRPGDVHPMDTQGYVKIVYGIDKDEILLGLNLCTQAYASGAIASEIFFKHINIAQERLKEHDSTR